MTLGFKLRLSGNIDANMLWGTNSDGSPNWGVSPTAQAVLRAIRSYIHQGPVRIGDVSSVAGRLRSLDLIVCKASSFAMPVALCHRKVTSKISGA